MSSIKSILEAFSSVKFEVYVYRNGEGKYVGSFNDMADAERTVNYIVHKLWTNEYGYLDLINRIDIISNGKRTKQYDEIDIINLYRRNRMEQI